MSAHLHSTFVPGCFRCDLHKDEINGWIDSLVVTRRGVVHEARCTYATGACSSATPWLPVPARNDRACSACLPDGLPERVA